MTLEQINLPEAKRALRFELWRNAAVMKGKNPDDCIDTLEVSTKKMDYGNKLAVAVAMSILTEHLASARAPKDWWQAVKERWFSKWLLKRFPVEYSYFDLQAVYPDPFDMGGRVYKARKITAWEVFYNVTNAR